MSDRAKELIAAVLALPADERQAVIDAATDSLDDEMTDDEWHESWAEEINRRLADIDSGRVKMIPHEEVMARLREKYG